MGRKFALLIGIDHYLDGPRKHKDGKTVELNNLQGCVNDVMIVEELLRHFGFQDQILLTSPTSLPSTTDPATLREADGLPTYKNIKAKFGDLLEGARDGDLFFFHFSGHGAPLTRIKESPSDGRTTDPSLLPSDYCCNEPAIRGWQLNDLLKEFNNKKVHVVVSLDSCFSGGSWRDDATHRSPRDWTPPPNLPSDEIEDGALSALPGHRHGNLDVSWDINPEGFILMAACLKNQVALEMSKGEKKHGVFTYELCQYLAPRTNEGRPTYRSICDHINHRIPESQTPLAFGRDRLVFLETREMFLAGTVQAMVQGQRATLPIGKAHGVKKGAVFISRWATSDVFLAIEKVDDFKSEGVLKGELAGAVPEFVPFQWYSEKTIEVLVDTTLGSEFRTALQDRLQERIASKVRVKEDVGSAGDEDAGTIRFQLQTAADDGIDIAGPALVGYRGPVYRLETKGESNEEKATRSADALAHLFRFTQVHSLHGETTEDNPRFRVILDSTSSPEAPFTEGHFVRYTFKNEDQCDLYFTVLNLGPGFHIQQMFPPQDTAEQMPPGATRSFRFQLTVPSELHRAGANHERPYRDIVRTVVTRGEPLSLKSMELPDIWDAAMMQCGVRRGSGRNAQVVSEFAWWIQDTDVYTRRKVH